MAAPPEDLRAHDRGSETPCECEKVEQAGGKLFTGQMVRVTTECRMPPGGVGRVRDRSAAASQVGKPDVADLRSMERRLERRLLILWLAAGAGKTSDIGHQLNLVRGEDLEKVRQRAGGVPHGPHREAHSPPSFISRTRPWGNRRSVRHHPGDNSAESSPRTLRQ
jgi:hypothetical protein